MYETHICLYLAASGKKGLEWQLVSYVDIILYYIYKKA